MWCDPTEMSPVKARGPTRSHFFSFLHNGTPIATSTFTGRPDKPKRSSIASASNAACTQHTPRRGRYSANYPERASIPSPVKRCGPSISSPNPRATHPRHGGCKRPSASCSMASSPSARSHERPCSRNGYGNVGPWKTRKTRTGFPFVSHRPWKSQRRRFPHSHNRDGDSYIQLH